MTSSEKQHILVNQRQRGNPILNEITNVSWVFTDNIIPDYQIGKSICILFLSLRYHLLHPRYIYTRIDDLKDLYTVRVLLTLIDIDDSENALNELSLLSLRSKISLLCAWNNIEIARYIENFLLNENKPPTLIRERDLSDDTLRHFVDCLTQVKGITKVDAVILASSFGTLTRILSATQEELTLCPGIGETKVLRLYQAFRQPFFDNIHHDHDNKNIVPIKTSIHRTSTNTRSKTKSRKSKIVFKPFASEKSQIIKG